jgi:hypothetical protein
LAATGEIETRSRLVPQDEWRSSFPIIIQAMGYVAWNQFVVDTVSQRARTNGEVLARPAREGLCLLQGLLLCGLCGRRIGVRYTGNGGLYAIYQCIWKHREALARHACLTAPLPAGTTGHFGAELRRFVLAQCHQGK